MRQRFLKRSAGAVILEALLAVVILAVGLTVLVQTMTAGLRAEAAAGTYIQAAALLSRPLTEQFVLPEAAAEGRGDSPFEHFRFRTAPLAPESTEDGLTLYPVETAVIWPAGRGERRVAVTTYRWQGGPQP